MSETEADSPFDGEKAPASPRADLITAAVLFALGTAITYQELLTWSKTAGSAYANTVPALIVCAALFIAINYGLTRVATWVERRLNRRGTTAGPVTTVAPTMIQGQGEPGGPAAHGSRIIGAGIESAEEAASDFVQSARERRKGHGDDT